MEILLMVILILQSAFLVSLTIIIVKTNKPGETVAEIARPVFVKDKPHEPTKEEIKYSKILANIEAYNGSGKGQTKV